MVAGAWAGGVGFAYCFPTPAWPASLGSLLLALSVLGLARWEGAGFNTAGKVATGLFLLACSLGGAASWSCQVETLEGWPLLEYRSHGAERRPPIWIAGEVQESRYDTSGETSRHELILRPDYWATAPLAAAKPAPGKPGPAGPGDPGNRPEPDWRPVRPPTGRVLLLVTMPGGGQANEPLPGDLDLLPGDRVEVLVELRRPDGDGNPGEFSYAGYLARRRILALGYVSPDLVRVAGKFTKTPGPSTRTRILRLAVHLREEWLERAGRGLPRSSRAVLSGLLVGDRRQMDQKTEEVFRRSGLSHLLSVSGLHVGLVAALLFQLAAALGWRAGIAKTLMLLGAGVYVLLCGASPSAVRAATMVGLQMAVGEERRIDRRQVWAAAGLAMLAKDPLLLHDLGFQLSFAATGGILFWYEGFRGKLAGWHRQLSGRAGQALAVTICAQLATLPFIWSAFGEFPTYGIVSNLLIAPGMGVLLSIALARALLAVVPGVDFLLQPLLDLTLRALLAWLGFIANCPAGVIHLPPLSLPALVIVAMAAGELGGMMAARGRRPFPHLPPGGGQRPGRRVSVMLTLLALATSLPTWAGSSRYLHVYFLDVGQGDAALLIPPGRRSPGMIVDTGPAYSSSRLIAAARCLTGGAGVDTVILSHAHDDHTGGLASLLATGKVKKVWIGPDGREEPGVAANSFLQVVHLAHEAGATVNRLEAGDRVNWPSGLSVVCCSPSKKDQPANGNEDSLVLIFRYGRVQLLFTGDVPVHGQRALVATREFREALEEQPAIRVVKVPHHGGRSAWWPAFYTTYYQPDLALVSVGRNPFGHPARELGEELGRRTVLVRTDQQGCLQLLTDGQRLQAVVWPPDLLGLRRIRPRPVWPPRAAEPGRQVRSTG